MFGVDKIENLAAFIEKILLSLKRPNLPDVKESDGLYTKSCPWLFLVHWHSKSCYWHLSTIILKENLCLTWNDWHQIMIDILNAHKNILFDRK